MFFGIAAFALCGHAEMMAVERDATDKRSYPSLLMSVMSFITVLYAAFGLFGYAAFHELTASNILLNLGDTRFITLVKCALALVLTCNYPISMFPATQVCEEILFGPEYAANGGITQQTSSQHKLSSSHNHALSPSHSNHSGAANKNSSVFYQNDDDDDDGARDAEDALFQTVEDAYSSSTSTPFYSFYYIKGVILRMFLVAITVAVCLALNDFGLLSSIVGSVCNGFMAFILPAIFWLKFGGDEDGPVKGAGWIFLGGVQLLLSCLFISMGLAVCLKQFEG